MQVFGEVLKGVPFFLELLNFAELLYAGKVGRGGAYYSFLLGAVYDKLTAEHRDIRIDFSLVLVSRALGGKEGKLTTQDLVIADGDR